MRIELWIPVIGATVSALLTAVLGPLISELRRPARRLSEIEYCIKRLELVEKMKRMQPTAAGSEPGQEDWSALDTELAHLLRFIRATSETRPEEPSAPTVGWARVLRRLVLPKPASVGGWVSTVIYYMYAVSAVTYFVIPLTEPKVTWGSAVGFILLSLLT